VRHLPHQLVDAFRSTLEEAADADLLVHVVDGSDPAPEEQVSAVREVLGEITRKRKEPLPPELLVINKIDASDEVSLARLRHALAGSVPVSARTGAGIAELVEVIADRLPRPEVTVEVLVPYTRGELVARAHADGEVLEEEHVEDGTRLLVRVRPDFAAALREYETNSSRA
jgi:GTP-binding protein HflX